MLSISLSPRKRVQLGWQVIIISLMDMDGPRKVGLAAGWCLAQVG